MATEAHERSANWSYEEVKILSQFVRDHTAQLCGTRCKASAKVDYVKKTFWQKASDVLKACGGKDRDWTKIRKKWQDVSSKARSYHRECNKTGNDNLIKLK